MRMRMNPDPPILAFFDFLAFFVFRFSLLFLAFSLPFPSLTLQSLLFSISLLFSFSDFPCFFLRFHFLFQGFWGLHEERNPCFFLGKKEPLFFPKKARVGGSGQPRTHTHTLKTLSALINQKNPRAHKDKIGTSPPPPKPPSKISTGPGKPNQKKSVHELFGRGIPEQKFNMSRACFPKEKHQNSQKWAKFMNFSFWPFFWFGLPGRLLIKRRILWTWVFLQKERILPGVHKIGAAISGPRIADTNFTDTRIFLN